MSTRYSSRIPFICTFLLAGIWLLFATGNSSHASLSISTVPVGDVGNTVNGSGFGSVNYAYSIGKYDITAAQYTAFLNAVAKADPNGLYDGEMASDMQYGCGISKSGPSGNYIYSTTKNPNFPVNYVSFWNACRFANWLQNGQPVGPQSASTTEDGAYTLTASGIANNSVTRNVGATWAVPTADEWYKAALYKGGSTNAGYWLYAMQSDASPSNVLSSTGTDNANFYNNGFTDPVNYLTPAGAFADSPSAYGTYDQNGDVFQWNESVPLFRLRGWRGGAFIFPSGDMIGGQAADPTQQDFDAGFRVVQLPEPATLGSLLLGLGMLASFRRRKTV